MINMHFSGNNSLPVSRALVYQGEGIGYKDIKLGSIYTMEHEGRLWKFTGLASPIMKPVGPCQWISLLNRCFRDLKLHGHSDIYFLV
jgi:hypothetical protein